MKCRRYTKIKPVPIKTDDEYYTPRYAILPLLKYLRPESTILCPFDTEDSQYVKVLCEHGFTVHTNQEQDFFTLSPSHYDFDYVISNPPYSKKTEVLERLFEWDIPFAMLIHIVGIFESERRFSLFEKNSKTTELMIFNKRVSYFKSYDDPKPLLNPPYSSVYICHNVLPQPLIFERINKTL